VPVFYVIVRRIFKGKSAPSPVAGGAIEKHDNPPKP
jgi:hypothetical protein